MEADQRMHGDVSGFSEDLFLCFLPDDFHGFLLADMLESGAHSYENRQNGARNCPFRKLRPLLDFCMSAGFEPTWLERRNLRCACSAVHAHVRVVIIPLCG